MAFLLPASSLAGCQEGPDASPADVLVGVWPLEGTIPVPRLGDRVRYNDTVVVDHGYFSDGSWEVDVTVLDSLPVPSQVDVHFVVRSITNGLVSYDLREEYYAYTFYYEMDIDLGILSLLGGIEVDSRTGKFSIGYLDYGGTTSGSEAPGARIGVVQFRDPVTGLLVGPRAENS